MHAHSNAVSGDVPAGKQDIRYPHQLMTDNLNQNREGACVILLFIVLLGISEHIDKLFITWSGSEQDVIG